MRLLLIRHGPSAHPAPRGLLPREAVFSWRTQYDAAGIARGATPPPQVAQMLAGADRVVASDLPRAVESAARLAPDRDIAQHDCLRELHLRVPHAPTRLPFMGWGLAIHTAWMLDIARKRPRPDDEQHQVQRAVTLCESLADTHENGVVAVVTHGVMRHTLAKALVTSGWARGPRHRGFSPWSVWEVARA